MIRYHGSLAPGSKLRSRIVPRPSAIEPADGESHSPGCGGERPGGCGADPPSQGRLSWAELMRRVFDVDVFECPRCTGRMRIVATITQPEVIRSILECVGLPARPPPLAPARELEQPEFDFSGA